MKILITGGTGFIGSHLVHKLINLNYEIILLKRPTTNIWRIKDIIDKCRVYNLEKFDILDQIFEKNDIEMVIHFATKYIKYEKNTNDIEEIIDTNIKLPSIILEKAIKNKVKYFINTGTCFEYKRLKKKLTETDPTEPFNFYSASKLAFEDFLKYYSYTNKIKSVTLRLFYPYGEKDNDYKLIPLVIKSLIENKELKLTSGEQKLDFTYVHDIVEAYIKAISFLSKSKKHYNVFNIGSGNAHTVKEIIKILQKYHKEKGKIKLGRLSYPENEIMYLEANNLLAKQKLNWIPKFSIERGLKKTYNFYIKNFNRITK